MFCRYILTFEFAAQTPITITVNTSVAVQSPPVLYFMHMNQNKECLLINLQTCKLGHIANLSDQNIDVFKRAIRLKWKKRQLVVLFHGFSSA